ncbi:hypothetical protein CA13_26760 [Planctomycetes bacterium CA13]|uniref:Uncharacterized protein n=1 Tax=Novipirellula herctigrandis TaxID=2527986 RepID=A0A5C5Z2H8_9BACT|nr:hypothetical protein CA13_26760 [Planctomycetes bacterium CA13]
MSTPSQTNGLDDAESELIALTATSEPGLVVFPAICDLMPAPNRRPSVTIWLESAIHRCQATMFPF